MIGRLAAGAGGDPFGLASPGGRKAGSWRGPSLTAGCRWIGAVAAMQEGLQPAAQGHRRGEGNFVRGDVVAYPWIPRGAELARGICRYDHLGWIGCAVSLGSD